jgi:hypothetical protein
MGLFKNRPIYSPLSFPRFGNLAFLNLRVPKRDSFVVQGIMDVAMNNLDKTGPAAFAQRAPSAAILEQELVVLFSKGDDSVIPRLGPQVAAGVQIGYMIGILENNSGIARHDQAEGHYWNALAMMNLQLSQQLPTEEFWEESNYSIAAGYYLGRKGHLAIQELLGRLQSQLRAA